MLAAPHLLRSELPHLVNVAPIILGQPFIADRSVEALHVGVLLRFAWLDVFNTNALAAGNVALMYSGPFSQRITSGLPLQAMICVSTRITRYDGSEKSTSMPSASRLKSSMTLSNLMLRPSSSMLIPDRIAVFGHRQRLGLFPQQSFAGLDTQVQF